MPHQEKAGLARLFYRPQHGQSAAQQPHIFSRQFFCATA
jgi:hypothetical protein